jgi:hypothetical protein
MRTTCCGRPKGKKNKNTHNAGGDRRSSIFKASFVQKQAATTKKNQVAADRFAARVAANRQNNYAAVALAISHPKNEVNLQAARNQLWSILEHPSMPQGRNLPSFCAANATDETVWHDKEHYDEGIDYDDDNEDNNDDARIKKFRQSYMPPPDSPLALKLKSIQKELSIGQMKKRWFVPSSSPMSTGLGQKPVPNAFYTNVSVRNWNPKAQYPALDIAYSCIFCGGRDLKLLGTRFRPAFCWSTVDWILYERLSCQNNSCKGAKGRHCSFSTIDPRFIAQLPTVVARDFEYVFPASGPGVVLDMATAFLHFP